jgi:hypothetical protein
LNDRRGTLLAVKPARCVADFGESHGDGRPWKVPLEDPIPAAATAGELRGKVLGWWCKPPGCHGEVLAELAGAVKAG